MTDKVRASHILIKHQGSRRKASWKDPEGLVITNRTRDDAVSQLKALRDDIVSGKVKFEDVAKSVSDCSSAKRAGDLGKGVSKVCFADTYMVRISFSMCAISFVSLQ
ncbi:peptidyl-prolyl cis-trans isomerase Pin1 [Tanacetum coccineum]